jgi:hypothetical protein
VSNQRLGVIRGMASPVVGSPAFACTDGCTVRESSPPASGSTQPFDWMA